MNEILQRQLALDYCCTPEEVADHKNHFTEHRFLEGRRRFEEGTECFLKLALINGKILFTGQPSIVDWCRAEYAGTASDWFLEAKNLRRLNDRLHQDGYQIEKVHPFFISEKITEICADGYEIRWYRGDDIEQFRGDERFTKAYSFLPEAPDVIGVAAVRDGQILGMAGASADSPTMWQIGINVDPQIRVAGIGKLLVTLLKNEILKEGALPYYGTAFSHFASQRVALGSGFVPTWAELVTSGI
ncbi:MAG: GNAT family N-acetyltransferase [Lachnospiraceae bacterium]|nr:GNAT family N-acetyltransferase [Lachnospiraceae bacterium]